MIIRRASVNDTPGIARVRVDTWRTAYAGIIPGEYLNELDYEESARQFRSFFSDDEDRSLVYVGENEAGDITAFACAGPERKDANTDYGEIYAVYVASAYQRQGIGGRLIAACARDLQESGKTGLILWVLAQNPYRSFYEKLEGVVSGSDFYAVQDHNAPLLAYKWEDIAIVAG